MRLSALWLVYRTRLRKHWMQELLAGLGIAVGVALLFSVQVANSSITSSAHEMLHAITGNASLQLTTRDAHGFDEGILSRVERLPDVVQAAPMLEERAALERAGRRIPVSIVGIDKRLKELNGTATSSLLLGGIVLEHGLLLPTSIASKLGVPPNPADGEYRSLVSVRGRATRVPISAVFSANNIGVLSDSSLAVMYLPVAQRLLGLRGRVSRILVVPRPGREAAARRELAALGGDRLAVFPVDQETRLLEQATAPNDQATSLYAIVVALVGLLFTFNAMLLTIPERRAAAAIARVMGFSFIELAVLVGFQTVVLGAVASGAGWGAGELLSRAAASNPPAYLAFAFPLGTHRIVPTSAILIALGGGVVVTCIAGLTPLIDARNSYSAQRILEAEAEQGNSLSQRARGLLLVVGLLIAAVTSILALVIPSLALAALLGLAVTTVMMIPVVFTAVLRGGDALGRSLRRNELLLAMRQVGSTPVRSIALAATAAVAVFGAVTTEGSHSDLLSGLKRNFADYLSSGDLWITVPGDQNGLTTEEFSGGKTLARVRNLPGVASARLFYASLLDTSDRRVWITGRPAEDRMLLPPSQLKDGNLTTANALVRRHGWIAVSQSLPGSRQTRIGGSIRLPTPTGTHTYRVAATLTNLGWGPGAVIVSAREYRRAWRRPDPSAIEIVLKRGIDPVAARREIEAALPSRIALQVQTRAQRRAQFNTLARQGLVRLSEISTLVLIAAAFAIATAMSAALWSRRVELAQSRISGFSKLKLWRTLILESAIVLAIGCLTGAVTGIYGHWLGSHWLELSTGFPAPTSLRLGDALRLAVEVAAAALCITAISGGAVARTPPLVGLQDQA